MCLVLAGHPFDLIKVRLQTMVVQPGQAPPFTGALDCARKTLRAEGVSVVLGGASPLLVGTAPCTRACIPHPL